MNLDLSTLGERFVAFLPVLLSLTVHEWAHAWTALRLGDDTAKLMGRVSLNPLVHIDLVGTVLLPLMGVPFGWAKPVPVNPLRFRPSVNMNTGMMITAAAGPISNLILAALGLAVIVAGSQFGLLPVSSHPGLYQVLSMVVLINVLLACFNLLPIPPLDGSRIAEALMPRPLRGAWDAFRHIGPLVLIAVILLPAYTGHSLFRWPMKLVMNLIAWATMGT